MTKASLVSVLFASVLVGCGGGTGPGSSSAATAGTEEGGDGSGSASVGASSESGGGETSDAPPPAKDTAAVEDLGVIVRYEVILLDGARTAGVKKGEWSVKGGRALSVQKADGAAVTELWLDFGDWAVPPLLNSEQSMPTTGNDYLVGKGGKVTRPDGKEPSAEERDAVLAEHGYVGGPSPLQKLAGAPGAPGQKRVAPADALNLLVGPIPGLDQAATKGTVSFTGNEDAAGRALAGFDVTTSLTLKSGKLLLVLDLAGKARIDRATGWVSMLTLAGDVTPGGQFEHDGKTFAVKGQGKAEVTRTLEMK